jgi:NAD(P)-dependent dehydrogenase (short-subunit alcohol dehydrogenase family)
MAHFVPTGAMQRTLAKVTTTNSDSTISREVVVMTGASAGLGRAIVCEFAHHGASIGLIARDQVRLEATAREVEDFGGKATPMVADVANPDDVERATEEAEGKFGPIDIWVNNAMATVFAPFEELTPNEFKRATEVTYFGQVWGTMAALKRLKARNHDHIVSRLCLGLQVDPAAIRLLRRQACDQGSHRHQVRTHPRAQ